MTNEAHSSNVVVLTAGRSGDGGQAPPGDETLAQAGPQDQAKTAEPETTQAEFKYTFDNVIRELVMLRTDMEYFRNVVALGSARTVRIKCLEKAINLLDRERDQAQRKRDRRR